MAVVPFKLYQDTTSPTLANPNAEFWTCSGSITSEKILKLNNNETVSLADNTDAASAYSTYGFSLQAGNNGDVIQVLPEGEHTNLLWSWTPNQPIFLTTSGAFSQTPSTGLFTLEVGVALSATKILIKIDFPIFS